MSKPLPNSHNYRTHPHPQQLDDRLTLRRLAGGLSVVAAWIIAFVFLAQYF
jgi:hypothetical protein